MQTHIKRLLLSLTLAAGCATAPRPPVAVETVGELSPSASHVIQAPVHATTDMGIGMIAGGGSDEVVTAAAPASEVETPEVAHKPSLVMGQVRQ